MAACPVPPAPGGADQMELLCSSVQKRAEVYQWQTEVSLAGEQLRLRLHNSKMIRDRCQQILTYPSSFVAKDVVSWLIQHKEAPDRKIATKIMQKLFEANILHHVCDEHPVFKDANLLYRFRSDDGTFFATRQMKIATRSKRLYEKLVNQEDSILQVRQLGSEQYQRTFMGFEMLDWMVKHNAVILREEGLTLCCAMLEFGIIQHITARHHFSDSDLLYQFSINFRRKRKLIEILSELPSSMAHRDSPDSPFCLRKLSAELPQSGFVCANDPPPLPPPPPKRSGNSCLGGARYSYPPLPKSIPGLPSVLKQPVTVEELLVPGAPYTEKTLRIVADDLGWGFVIRGNSPCHIQAMDPGGPAAIGGMKIRQFIKSVNGLNCLYMPYRTVYKHVTTGPRTVIFEVLEHND